MFFCGKKTQDTYIITHLALRTLPSIGSVNCYERAKMQYVHAGHYFKIAILLLSSMLFNSCCNASPRDLPKIAGTTS
eukprot:c36714_g1_i1 orf=1-228(-)